jgi:hypothetical protein
MEGKCCHFIYLNIDEVVDKALKQPTTLNKHAQTQTSIIKQAMTNSTLLLTRVTPNDCEIRRGCGYSLWAPRPNFGLRRWLSKCLCLTHRGRWHDPLPSSCSLGWWRLCCIAGCGESRSHAEWPVDECSGPSSHPGGVPSPSWEYPSWPIGLELILLTVGLEVVDVVLQPMLVSTDPRCDVLPGGIGNIVIARGPESWSLVSAKDFGSE